MGRCEGISDRYSAIIYGNRKAVRRSWKDPQVLCATSCSPYGSMGVLVSSRNLSLVVDRIGTCKWARNRLQAGALAPHESYRVVVGIILKSDNLA